MTVQTEFFPKTELDDANAVLSKLLSDEEKAEKAIATAEDKLSQIQTLIYKQRRVITHLQTEMPAADATPVVEVAEDLEEAEFEPLGIEGDVLDPESGEVRSKAEREEAGEATTQVLVLWPGRDDVVATEVGEHTTYGELVADYLAADGSDEELADFRVVNLDADRRERDLQAVIVPLDYGRRFAVEACALVESAA